MRVKKERYRTGEKALTPREYEKLISVIDHLVDEVLIKLAVSIGARREDLTGIKVENIHLDELKLSFNEQKKRRIHTVPLSPEMARLIRQLLNTRGKHQGEYLFPFTGRTAYTKLQKYCDKAGIPRRPFHTLRATCMKRCQAAGWTPEQVSRLTGDTIAVIQEHYAWPSSSEMQEVATEKPLI
jgi:integrase